MGKGNIFLWGKQEAWMAKDVEDFIGEEVGSKGSTGGFCVC